MSFYHTFHLSGKIGCYQLCPRNQRHVKGSSGSKGEEQQILTSNLHLQLKVLPIKPL